MAVLGGIEKTATFGFANSIVKDFILYRENVGHANYLSSFKPSLEDLVKKATDWLLVKQHAKQQHCLASKKK